MTAPGIVVVIVGYFLGGLPIGVLVARSKGVDLFKVGSGNVGTTNVIRALGFKYGILTWLGDVGKGLVAALVAKMLGQPEAVVAAVGLAAILGHCFSPFLHLRGGRGIATGLGVLLAIDWRVGTLAFSVWIVVVLASQLVSLASLAAAASLLPLMVWLHPTDPMIVLGGSMASIVFIRHKPNLDRLLRGEEHKFGSRKKEGEEQ
jgi:glycerol-3-phosphate acyltransferase PlsY